MNSGILHGMIDDGRKELPGCNAPIERAALPPSQLWLFLVAFLTSRLLGNPYDDFAR
ncbi:MAG: hypothetical protein IT425_10845 [Pirellulales bacterium]|nr:hypothetical protein [Pirellulales bacterium]